MDQQSGAELPTAGNTEPPAPPTPKGRKRRWLRLPEELRSQLLALVDQGMPNRAIAKQLDISESIVRDQIKRRVQAKPVPCRTCSTPSTAVDELGDCLKCKLLREPQR